MKATIETAILARLKAAEPLLGWQWRMAETYPADWDAFLKEKRQISGLCGHAQD
jgi:phage gp37-like protein